MKNNKTLTFTLILFLQLGCSNYNDYKTIHFKDFKVTHQRVGPSGTNCYLIYDLESKEAAIIDPGWKDIAITNLIKEKNLELKYILLTHGHLDHYIGVQQIKKQFPNVKLCLNKDDSSDSLFIGIPDLFVKDNQTLKLGSLEIKTIHTPGHSPGGICYHAKNILFSGDMLFYRTIGLYPDSLKEDMIKSIKRIYETLPDSIVVYPGHGKFTDIGSEKRENEKISSNKVNIN